MRAPSNRGHYACVDDNDFRALLPWHASCSVSCIPSMLPAEMQSRSSSGTLPSAPSAPVASSGLGERFTLWSRGNSALRWLQKVFPFVASGVGLWLCVRFCSTLEWRAVAHDIRHVGAGAALLLLAPIVGNFVHMVGWRGLLPSNARPGLGRSLAIFLAAQAGNELGLGVLGESLKVSEFPSEHRSFAWRAMLLDNLTALVALLAVVLSMALFLSGSAMQHALPRSVALGGLLGAGVAALGGLGIWARTASSSPLAVLLAFAAHYIGKLWIVAEFALALALLGTATLRSSAVLGLVSTLASAVGAAIPGQLGVLEAALKGSAASCGVGVCTLVSVALLRRARSILWVALGAVLFWQLRAQRTPQLAEAYTRAGAPKR